MSDAVSLRAASRAASQSLYDQAVQHLPGGNARSTVFVAPRPPYLSRGGGFRVTDVDGHELIDAIGNYTTLVHGHGHPIVVAAAIAAISDGISFSLPTEGEIALAIELKRRLPASDRWRFVNSGTEAVMAALRLARFATGRDCVVRFDGSYHGTYDCALPPGALGTPRATADTIISLPQGDAASLLAVLDQRGEEIACVLCDAMPNRAGLVPIDRDFVALLREETARRGILLVFDEVLTFRVAFGGLQAVYDVEPDITTLGKVIGGGFPIGAVGGRAAVMDLFDPRDVNHLSIGGTFSANPVSMRAGVAAMQLLSPQEILRINALGDRLRGELTDAGWDVAGRGSLLRIREPDPAKLWWSLYEEGILVATNGLVAISTAMDDGVIDAVLAAFARVRRRFR